MVCRSSNRVKPFYCSVVGQSGKLVRGENLQKRFSLQVSGRFSGVNFETPILAETYKHPVANLVRGSVRT